MIGVLGAGQLARMMRQAAKNLGVELAIYGSSPEEPALQLEGPHTIGSNGNIERLRQFFLEHSPIGFESEFWDVSTLKSAARGVEVSFVPSLDVVAQVQDKLEQKKIFEALGLRTSPFVKFQNEPRIGDWLENLWTHFGGPFVLKWARMGYDGKGTFFFNSYRESREAEAFIRAALRAGHPVYAEKRIKFIRELAMVACFSANDSFGTYPLAISEQAHGICHWVRGPAVGLGVNPKLEIEAADWCRKIAKQLNLRGTFALEFFETEDGKLWLNELAPRVHNTGHYTQDACKTSQFENHILALVGADVRPPEVRGFFVMLNLIGPAGSELDLERQPDWPEVPPGSRLEWYGKRQLKPGRKMGHVNAVVQSAEDVPRVIAELTSWETRWVQMVAELRR